MKGKFLLKSGYIFLCLALVLALLPATVLGGPLPPMVPNGYVYINGVRAEDGTLVEAKINNVVVASCNTTTLEGINYALVIEGESGDQVHFFVLGIEAEESPRDWKSGTFHLDLHVTVPPSTEAEILTYSFAEQTGPATINSTAGTIDIEVEYGTDVTALVANFTTSADITSIQIDGVDQVSGVTANNFTEPVTYVVTAQDGTTTKNWVVTVTVPGYNLTVNVTPSVGGNVTVNGTMPPSYPNTTTWNYGENVTLNATAAGNYSFNHWSGNLSGSTNPTNITMNSDKNVTAYFSQVGVTYNLTVNVTPVGGGDIKVNDVAPDSYPYNYTFNDSDLVDLNAVPAGGYSFVNWSGNLSGSTNPTNITMTGNYSITANFAINRYNLTVNVTPSVGGNVTVNGTMPTSYPNTTTWNYGENVTLNATAASNYSFNHWSGDLSGSTNPTNITMNSDKNVTANFGLIGVTHNLTVNVTPDGGGDIEVNGVAPGSYPYNYTFNDSDLVDLNAVPAGGYSFVNWSGNLSGSTNPTNITMDSDKSVTANFAEVITATLEGHVGLQRAYGVPNATWVTNLTVTFLQSNIEVRGENVTTDEWGNFTILAIDPDTYDIRIKARTTLSSLAAGVEVEAPITVVDFGKIFGVLREGDITGDNYVGLDDYTLVGTAYDSVPVDDNWNGDCDFNRDGYVGLDDYTLVGTYYDQEGD